MKKFIQLCLLSLTIFTISFIVYSCEKDSVKFEESNNNENTNVLTEPGNDISFRDDEFEFEKFAYEYYLDDDLVSSTTYSLSDSTLRVIVEADSIDADSVLIKYLAYTNDEGYIGWGDAHNISLSKVLLIEDHLYHIADSSGVIAIEETYDTVPNWYLEYQEDYIEEVLGSASLLVSTTFYDDNCGGDYSPSLVKGTTHSLKPFGWNDRISKLRRLNPAATTIMFNRTWFRDHLVTYGPGGWETICLSTANNNRTTSLIVL